MRTIAVERALNQAALDHYEDVDEHIIKIIEAHTAYDQNVARLMEAFRNGEMDGIHEQIEKIKEKRNFSSRIWRRQLSG